MSKYIIELKDDVQVVQKVGVTENGNAFVMNFYKDQLEELNSDYINEHYRDLQDDAYQRGLEDAWNIARKIAMETNDGGVSISALYEMFGTESMCMIMKNNTVYDATDKLKAYEEKQKADDEIKVGDIVERYLNDKLDSTGIYLGEDGDFWNCLFWTGTMFITFAYPKDQFKKTGRHFDIDKILKEMQSQ